MTTARPRARRGEGAALRTEILHAARDLLAETGSDDAVSVRAVAERVGVSTPSIYLHFADKDALIDAVCEEVFTELGTAMEEAAQGADDPFDSLRQRGLAYVQFALDNPEHYRIVQMTRGNEVDGARDLLATSTYTNLVESVRRCQEAGVFAPDAEAVEIATTLWAAAHGVAALLINRPELTSHEDRMRVADQCISAAGLGLAMLHRLPDPDSTDCPEGLDVVTLLNATFGPPTVTRP